MGAIRVSARQGYELWADTWDATPSPIVALEHRALLPWIADIRPRRAIDVGCGTGRWTERLSAIGVDASPAMLARAAVKPALRGRLAARTSTRAPQARRNHAVACQKSCRLCRNRGKQDHLAA